MTTRYLDYEGGNDSNDGSSFANRKKTFSSASSGLGGGDTIKIMASLDPTSLSQNATWTAGSDTVTLTTAVTANIDTCESAWTGSTNVTATAQSSTQREGTNAASLAIASAFTTGLVAYHALGGATDFSAYQQVSFLIRVNASLAAGVLTLTLCSDAAGVTAVNTIAIPALTSGWWVAVCVDTAGALGASIQSVALNALSDPGTITVFLDNIIACKASSAADSLTHYSLISKNSGTDPWMAIDSINGTTIKLAGAYQNSASRSGFQPYYYGATATQTIYKREPIIITAAIGAGKSGNTYDSPLNIECGWDRTAMSSQSGQSFYRLRDPGVLASFQGVWDNSTNTYMWLNRMYIVNAGNCYAFMFNRDCQLGETGAIACSYGYLFNQGCTWAVGNYYRACIHCFTGMRFSGSGSPREVHLRWTQIWGPLKSNFQYVGVQDSSSYNLDSLVFHNTDFQGLYTGYNGGSGGRFDKVIHKSCTFKNFGSTICSAGGFDAFFDNCTIDGGTTSINTSAQQSLANAYYWNQSGVTTDHKIVFGSSAGNCTVVSDTSTRHTASDYAWKCTYALGDTKSGPFLSIAKIACNANEQRTVTAWMRRDNTGVVNRLLVKGDYYPGIDDDVSVSMTAAVNTWQQVTLQFTPTQDAVVEVFWAPYGTAASGNNCWIDDLAVS